MRRVISFFLCALLLVLPPGMSASAEGVDLGDVNTTVEYLDNGDYIVTTIIETIQPNILMSASKSGSKTLSYYNASNVKMWSVIVYGTFTYTYGTSAKATSASATVNIYNSNVNFISKSAYESGATAYATGTVSYKGTTTSRTVSLTCDAYGELW